MPRSSAPDAIFSTGEADRPGDLVVTLLRQLAVSGPAEISARSVAAEAGVAPSSINYHFGSFERLYGSAQAHAVREASAWLARRLDEARLGAPWPAAAFPAFTAGVIDDWCVDQRLLAQAEAAAGVVTPGGPSGAPMLDWLNLWSGFWAEAAGLFDLPPGMGPVMSAILHSERLGHLARWRPAYDRPALEELCVRLTARVTGDPALLARSAPWRERAEGLTRSSGDPLAVPVAAERIADAVVATVDEDGGRGLTHRAVAVRAGVSLGAVTHHFPTRQALISAGYASLYGDIFRRARSATEATARPGDVAEHMAAFMQVGRVAPRSRALETFFLAATRDEAFTDFAALIRYSRGRGTLTLLADARSLSRLDGVLISHWAGGVGRVVAARPEMAAPLLAQLPDAAKAMFG